MCKRLDQALAALFPDLSRARLQIWVDDGRVTVDNQPCRKKDRLRGGETLRVDIVEEAPEVEFLPEDIPLDIVYEDDDILVINKPAGLVVHPGAGNWSGTLLNGLLHHDPRLALVPRAGIVHRLDKDTSGLMLVAKNLAAHKALVDALSLRDVSREYVALVQGVMIAGGTVDSPIGRHSRDRKRMAVTIGGKEAITHYRVADRFASHSLVDVKLETGRTHQIRVHLSSIHFPIVGDPVYGGRLRLPVGASDELIEALQGFRRQALHARKLGLLHPVTGELMEWSVKACVTTRHGGVSQQQWQSLNLGTHVNDDPDHVAENRRRLKQAVGQNDLLWLEQVHGINVLDGSTSCSDPAVADASVSRTPGQVCAVMTADCLPVLFTNDAGDCVAAAHAGWRGLHAGVLESTLSAMNCSPDSVQAWLGPAIGPDAFEVGEEVYQAFADKLGEVDSAFKPGRAGRWMADIYQLARLTLGQCGVQRVSGGAFCTFSEADRFFSYRRSPTTGRMASLIWLDYP
ncbi:unnamed protein product [Cyprideis torosa]|uniref:Uncharacterized protein n=1 Tax=Cyprideis torosa TaxID=163714 RepID=A0A7R8WJW6_9CRUS|nr:unnamed protein product [Cyprideis torosa]CAG0899682.1 unnamed protein product [Cyprideis torosa]